jgi:hypothetical protein
MFIRSIYVDVDEIPGLQIAVLFDIHQAIDFRRIRGATSNSARFAYGIDEYPLHTTDFPR